MNILFVCTGNTCRSPMAEGYLKSAMLQSINVKSCGFLSSGDCASENSVLAMQDLGVDISAHRSNVISAEDIDWADKIICLSDNHRDTLLSLGVASNKLSVLGDGIPDPFGQDLLVYKTTALAIADAIDGIIFSGEILQFTASNTLPEDFESIAMLEEITFSEPWSLNALLESFAHGTRFICAKQGDALAGYMGLSAVAGEGYVTNIAVFPEFKRRGVASLILFYAFSLARKLGLEFISLEVRESNNSAIALYQKFGFCKEGIRKNFYDNPKEDAIIMTRRLNFK